MRSNAAPCVTLRELDAILRTDFARAATLSACWS
jgi:hypothetical protein